MWNVFCDKQWTHWQARVWHCSMQPDANWNTARKAHYEDNDCAIWSGKHQILHKAKCPTEASNSDVSTSRRMESNNIRRRKNEQLVPEGPEQNASRVFKIVKSGSAWVLDTWQWQCALQRHNWEILLSARIETWPLLFVWNNEDGRPSGNNEEERQNAHVLLWQRGSRGQILGCGDQGRKLRERKN